MGCRLCAGALASFLENYASSPAVNSRSGSMIRISEFRTLLFTTLSYNDSHSFNPFPLCLAPIWRSLASLVRLLHSLSTRRLLPKHRAHDNGVWMRPQYAYAYTLNERLRVAHRKLRFGDQLWGITVTFCTDAEMHLGPAKK